MTERFAAECMAVLAAMKGEAWTKAHSRVYQTGFFARVDDDTGRSAVAHALMNLTFRPSVAELWDIVDMLDGRPRAEEAWSLYPKDETSSACVTDEMLIAGRAAQDLIRSGDMVAARMAFIEAYRSEVMRARGSGRRVSWMVTLGTDPNGREVAFDEYARRTGLTGRETAALKLLYGVDSSPMDADTERMIAGVERAHRMSKEEEK